MSICWANISHARFFRFIAAGCWLLVAVGGNLHAIRHRAKKKIERTRARLLHVSTLFETLFVTRFVRELYF